MTAERDQTDDATKLPDEEARRLLARASELESARSSELSIAELREVASEAGIAPNAFEQALVELRTGHVIAHLEPVQLGPKARSRFSPVLLESLRTIALIAVTLLLLMLAVDLF